MAREEDHDDLAEVFNKQSEVLTSQFGEFFLADLIATQNLTRRITKSLKSEGKAIVGQVQDKAVGMMSVSTEIEYTFIVNPKLQTSRPMFRARFVRPAPKTRLRRRNQIAPRRTPT